MEQFRICKYCNFSGVYAIINIRKNKIYIGSSSNIKRRLENHKVLLKYGKSHIREMQEDYKNGDKFISYVITPVRIREEKYCKYDDLKYFEHLAIKTFNCTNPEIGYNLKEDTGRKKLKEERYIDYAYNDFKEFIDQMRYGYMQEKTSWKTARKRFVDKVLNEWRF